MLLQVLEVQEEPEQLPFHVVKKANATIERLWKDLLRSPQHGECFAAQGWLLVENQLLPHVRF